MTTPSTANTALAKEIFPCEWPDKCGFHQGHQKCAWGSCNADHRPAVALALQSKDDSAALEIAELKLQVKQAWKQLEPAYELLAEDHRKLLGEVAALKGEIARLRAALEPFAQTADRVNSLSDNAEIKCAVGYLRKARAALQTDGGKL